MAIEIKMPQLSDTMDKVTILLWAKKVGDTVARGDVLAEVATDKADLEIEAFNEGVLLSIDAEVGQVVKVGSVIAHIGEVGESATRDLGNVDLPTAKQNIIAVNRSVEISSPISDASSETPSSHVKSPMQDSKQGRVHISPLARNVAEQHGLDYAGVKGTGDAGRIVKRDIEQAISDQNAGKIPSPFTHAGVDSLPVDTNRLVSQNETQGETRKEGDYFPLTKMRAAIAERMTLSSTTIPHFHVASKVHVDDLMSLRESLKILPQYEGITYNHLIIKAVALSLRAFARINGAYKDGVVFHPSEVNIGIITAVDDGLLIPVLKNADLVSLAELVSESRGLVQRARAGKPKSSDLLGATFCISNMGKAAVDEFTAIISPGQAGILAVGPIHEDAVVVKGQVQAGHVVRLTLSVDHRIIDGVLAGAFMSKLSELLHNPVLLLV